MWPTLEAPRFDDAPPKLDAPVAAQWLEAFLRDEMIERRGISRAVIGLSGGIDSAVTAYLCARALGPENIFAFALPYRTSSAESFADAQLVASRIGIHLRCIEISAAVDGYLQYEPEADARRRGNVMARTRMLVLFDQSAKLGALPIGTGNKTERMLGYYTWHADDTPPLNPLGDLFKSQVWALAAYLGIPEALIRKAPSADLHAGQTDEGDLGVTYARADAILSRLLLGYRDAELIARGFSSQDVAIVRARVESTHWKRRLPTTAMLSNTAINEFYLRPVDY